jgi:hypothetical protein
MCHMIKGSFEQHMGTFEHKNFIYEQESNEL